MAKIADWGFGGAGGRGRGGGAGGGAARGGGGLRGFFRRAIAGIRRVFRGPRRG